MIDAPRIQGMRLARPEAAPQARRPIATFDLDLCGIEIRGCELIRTASNGLSVRGPASCVVFVVDSTRHAVMEIARRAYVALGGDDLPDWARDPSPLQKVDPAAAEVA